MNETQLLAALEQIDDRLDELQAGVSRADLVATIQRHSSNPDAYDFDEMSLSALESLADEVSKSGGVYAGRAGGAGGSSGDPASTGVSLEDLEARD